MGQRDAKVTADGAEAARLVAAGTPVVLVGEDSSALVDLVAGSVDEAAHVRLLAVMVGDPDDPAVLAAAQEMAAELWPWVRS